MCVANLRHTFFCTLNPHKNILQKWLGLIIYVQTIIVSKNLIIMKKLFLTFAVILTCMVTVHG